MELIYISFCSLTKQDVLVNTGQLNKIIYTPLSIKFQYVKTYSIQSIKKIEKNPINYNLFIIIGLFELIITKLLHAKAYGMLINMALFR